MEGGMERGKEDRRDRQRGIIRTPLAIQKLVSAGCCLETTVVWRQLLLGDSSVIPHPSTTNHTWPYTAILSKYMYTNQIKPTQSFLSITQTVYKNKYFLRSLGLVLGYPEYFTLFNTPQPNRPN